MMQYFGPPGLKTCTSGFVSVGASGMDGIAVHCSSLAAKPQGKVAVASLTSSPRRLTPKGAAHQPGATAAPLLLSTAVASAGPVQDPAHVLYGGTCTRCGSTHHLTCDSQALSAAQQLLDALEEHQRLDYAAPVGHSAFHRDMLFTKGPGRMLGVLVAALPSGQLTTFKAFSGQIGDTWYIPGWVGPVCTLTSNTLFYQQTRAVTEQVSSSIDRLQLVKQRPAQAPGPDCTAGNIPNRRQHRASRPTKQQLNSSSLPWVESQLQLLKARRKGISHHLLQQIQHSYHTHDVAGRAISLLDVYLAYRQLVNPQVKVTRAGGFLGFPAGTGDCCAPKLLHAAAVVGARPVGLVEFWYGSAPGTATPAKAGRPIPDGGLCPMSSRQHTAVYGMCEKCEAILGTMLCSCSSGA